MSAETATAEAAWTPDQPIISIKAVHKSFGDLEVLKGVSIDVMKGEVMAAPALGCPAAGKPDFGLWGRRVPLNLRRQIGGGFSYCRLKCVIDRPCSLTV